MIYKGTKQFILTLCLQRRLSPLNYESGSMWNSWLVIQEQKYLKKKKGYKLVPGVLNRVVCQWTADSVSSS